MTRYLTLDQMAAKVGRSRSVIYTDLANGRLPLPTVSIGARGKRWLEADIDAHLAQLAEAQRTE